MQENTENKSGQSHEGKAQSDMHDEVTGDNIDCLDGEEAKEAEILLSEEELLRADVEKLTEELHQMKDRSLRVMAEMDNVRKRLEKEKQDFIKFGLEGFIKEMLPVLDSCDKALAVEQSSAGDSKVAFENLIEGVRLVFKQMMTTLEKRGLKVIEAQDKPFDPNLHQAVSRIERGDLTEDQVVQEYSKGYLLHDRLIRPSMVVVGAPAEHKD